VLIHPQFDPIIFSVGPLAVRWYGLMYVIAFVAVIMLGKLRVRQGLSGDITEKDVDDMLIYGVIGVIVLGVSIDVALIAAAIVVLLAGLKTPRASIAAGVQPGPPTPGSAPA